MTSPASPPPSDYADPRTPDSVIDLPRKVGFWGAIAVMVGVVIGSGIFRTPTTIAQNLNDPLLILAFWLAGGLIALCGALTFAELTALMPRSGGVYVFIREGFGRCPAFVFGWTYMLIAKPAAAGGIAFIFAEHLNKLLAILFREDPTSPWAHLYKLLSTQSNVPLLTCCALFLLTLINVLGMRGSTRFAIVLTSLKYTAIVGVIVLGVFAAIREVLDPAVVAAIPTTAGATLSKSFLAAVVPVLAAVMWTYDGWADVGAIAGEVKNPERTLPRVYVVGTLSVIGLYLLANIVYLWHIPLPEMAATNTVAPLLLEKLAGPIGATAVTVLIILSTLGSCHASVMTGARVTFAQAQDGLLFRFLGRISPTFETPAVALWVQFTLSCVSVLLLADFSALTESFVFTMWIFYGMAAVSVFILRARGNDMVRPFRVPGYPYVPAIFILASLGMTVLSILNDPKTTGIWLGVLAAGVPVYYLWKAIFPAPRTV